MGPPRRLPRRIGAGLRVRAPADLPNMRHRNRYNRREAEVGNVCVHNFMQLASRRIFAVLRRVEAEITKSLNPAALELFERRGVLSEAERQDYLEYWRKRTNMTDDQRSQKIEINRRVIEWVERESRRLRENFVRNGIKPRDT